MSGRQVLAEAIERNVAEFLLDMGQAGGGDERSDVEIRWTLGGSPLAYHNAVVRCTTTPDRADTLIDDWSRELTSRGLAGSWHVSPRMTPSNLAARLEAHGFVDTGDEPAMSADLSSIAVDPPPSPLDIHPVTEAADLAAYESVLSKGFGEGPREAAWVTEIWRRIGLDEDSRWRHYVGRDGGEPVATTSLLVADRVGGIYFVCTIPSARRRGFGAAITQLAMIEARRLGCRLAVLGASEMGYPVYRQLGFEEVFRYRLFEYVP